MYSSDAGDIVLLDYQPIPFNCSRCLNEERSGMQKLHWPSQGSRSLMRCFENAKLLSMKTVSQYPIHLSSHLEKSWDRCIVVYSSFESNLPRSCDARRSSGCSLSSARATCVNWRWFSWPLWQQQRCQKQKKENQLSCEQIACNEPNFFEPTLFFILGMCETPGRSGKVRMFGSNMCFFAIYFVKFKCDLPAKFCVASKPERLLPST